MWSRICSSSKHSNIGILGGHAVKEAMLGVIIATAEKDLGHVEGLAMALKGHTGSLAP